VVYTIEQLKERRGLSKIYAMKGYKFMDKGDVWETATKDIPNLMYFCEKIIEES